MVSAVGLKRRWAQSGLNAGGYRRPYHLADLTETDPNRGFCIYCRKLPTLIATIPPVEVDAAPCLGSSHW